MWVATQDLLRSAAHPFYARLNQVLDQHDFDGFVEGLCERFYAEEGRPGLPPGRYFRLQLIGYFEGLDAERAIAWRAADSFALRELRQFEQSRFRRKKFPLESTAERVLRTRGRPNPHTILLGWIFRVFEPPSRLTVAAPTGVPKSGMQNRPVIGIHSRAVLNMMGKRSTCTSSDHD